MGTNIEEHDDYYPFRIPIWAIFAIEYGDTNGLMEEKGKKVECFLNRCKELMKKEGKKTYILTYNIDEPYFSRTNAFDHLGGEVVDAKLAFI